MIESLCLISAKFFCCILMIDSCFSHAMKKLCTIQSSPKVLFFSLILTSGNSNERDFFCEDGQIDQRAS
jgi:hypothetical protein